MKEDIYLGSWSKDKLESIMHKASRIKDAGSRIKFVSRQFLNLDYKESALIGDINTPEIFVINLEGVDCFTFIDYMEAMRLSDSFSEFKENLKRVRYRSGEIAFENRNHFFTDWREFNSDFVDDVTGVIGAQRTKVVLKTLNAKEDGGYFLEGIKPLKRKIKYIPSGAIDDSVINRLKTGDYVGIYSSIQGLDVSHVGIIIRDGDITYLRHASSAKKYRKVVDEDFRNYISDKPGIVILKPKN